MMAWRAGRTASRPSTAGHLPLARMRYDVGEGLLARVSYPELGLKVSDEVAAVVEPRWSRGGGMGSLGQKKSGRPSQLARGHFSVIDPRLRLYRFTFFTEVDLGRSA